MAEKIKLGSNGNFGVKEGGTLAYNDENGVFKAIELSSSRASSGTYVAESGLIADAEVGVPRIDWTNGVGELLLEPQSTNLLSYSEDFSNAIWIKNGTASLGSNTTSPSGDNTGVVLSGADGVWGGNNLNRSFPVSGSVDYTASVWIKNVNATTCRLGVRESTTGGVITNVQITPTSEWVRYDVTYSNPVSTTIAHFMIYDCDGDIEIWGAQLEQLSYPTSYIRTEGSQVTRIADAVTGNSSLGQVINSSEGVLYAEMSALADDGTQNLLGLNGGSISNSILFGFSSSNGIRFYGAESGTATGFDLTTAATITTTLKLALRWSLNDVKFYINGTQVGTDTTFATSSSLNELSFDNGSGASLFYGRIRDLKVYDTALTDAELTTLTTI